MNWRDKLRGSPAGPEPEAPEKPLLVSERKELEALRRAQEIWQEVSNARFTPRPVPVEVHTAASPGYPMTIWSDWHWGEVVNLEETAGKNEFNHDIAVARVDNLVNNTINLLANYGGMNPSYPGMTICLGGDMISGLIHDELVETNWAPVGGQLFQVHEVLSGALLRMADVFGSIHVPCVVGNHGRNAKRPRAKVRIRENSEYWLYKALEKHFVNDSRFRFEVAEQTDIAIPVYNHQFLLTHGDALGTNGGDGIIGAIGPIKRGTVKIGNSQDRADKFDTMIVGHWHTAQPRGDLFPCIVNGSLKGYDEYARAFLRASPSRPSQQLWLVSPKHGVAAQWPVYL
jgi:hypothetical protein